MRQTMKSADGPDNLRDDQPSPVEQESKYHSHITRASDDPTVPNVFGAGSLGVRRVEALAAQLTQTDKVFLVISIVIVAYAYTLNNVLNYSYQPQATAAMEEHSLTATITVLRGVIAAAAQPIVAKLTDVFGRVELVYLSIFFYCLGMILSAAAQNIPMLSAGQVLFQVGFTTIQLVVEVLIADLTSLRSRLFFSYIPSTPYLINTWVSGNIASAVLGATTWRWAFGMWAIIFPVCCIPLLATLWTLTRRAKNRGQLEAFKTPYQHFGAKTLTVELFWQLDIIGMILVIAVFGLILVPMTLAGGVASKWRTAKIIVPLVIGFCCIPVFIFWEMTCKYPLVPFHLLKDRGVWGALGIALFLNFAWYMQGDYLYTVLIVAFDFSITSATRISGLYTFVSVLVGVAIGVVVRFIKQLKWILVAGTALFMVAFGLLINFRGGNNGSSQSGIIGAEVLLGIAGGMFPYTAQASIQSCTRHEHVAVITGLYLAIYSIGSALGTCVSGAYWTNTIVGRLTTNLGNATLAAEVYADPFTFASLNAFGTSNRTAVVSAYQDTQRTLCIIGICLCVPLIAFGLCTRNHKLGATQSLQHAEKYDPNQSDSGSDERSEVKH